MFNIEESYSEVQRISEFLNNSSKRKNQFAKRTQDQRIEETEKRRNTAENRRQNNKIFIKIVGQYRTWNVLTQNQIDFTSSNI